MSKSSVWPKRTPPVLTAMKALPKFIKSARLGSFVRTMEVALIVGVDISSIVAEPVETSVAPLASETITLTV